MTKEELTQIIEAVCASAGEDGVMSWDECTEAAAAVLNEGLVEVDDDLNFHPTPILNDYPDSVKQFVVGMCMTNDAETKH